MKPPSDTERFLASWMKLRQLVQAANFNRFHQAGVSATQFMTLNMIRGDGMTLSELSRALNLSAATVHATVVSLEARGLLQRARHPDDARKVCIGPTAEGRKLQNHQSRDFQDYIGSIFEAMRPSIRKGLLDGLEAMIAGAPEEVRVEATGRDGRARKPAHSSARSPHR